MFAGTAGPAWVSNHAFVILNTLELDDAAGNKERLVKLRNPWGRTNWTGAYSEGSEEYKRLQAHFGNQME